MALGVIGSETARNTLDAALRTSEEVRESAAVALANLDYIKTKSSNGRFAKMTGG